MSRPMRATAFAPLIILLLAVPALAKPWQGIEPGVSLRDKVTEKFGEPSRTVTQEGKEVIAYFGERAIRGTMQVQFKVDPASKVVERVDVFPAAAIDKDAIEGTYGPVCPPSGKAPEGACYVKKITDDLQTYFVYSKLGMAIFFKEDGKTVRSLVFTPVKAK
jgi:hypothetical protein